MTIGFLIENLNADGLAVSEKTSLISEDINENLEKTGNIIKSERGEFKKHTE